MLHQVTWHFNEGRGTSGRL